MGLNTRKNLEKLFTEESIAAARAEIFALKAKMDGLSHIAALFRAVSASKSVHARRFLRLLRGSIGSNEDNLKEIFENSGNIDVYSRCKDDAETEGEKIIGHTFEQTLEVEKGISSLYPFALKDRVISYFVCGVCGHIHIGEAPDHCPVCNAIKSKFKKA